MRLSQYSTWEKKSRCWQPQVLRSLSLKNGVRQANHFCAQLERSCAVKESANCWSFCGWLHLRKALQAGADAVRRGCRIRSVLAPKIGGLNKRQFWELQNCRKFFKSRRLRKLLWDFAYLCWANTLREKPLHRKPASCGLDRRDMRRTCSRNS